MAVLSVEDLTVAYGDHTVFKDLSFTVNDGDFLVVVGENGVGKTTLVRALLGLIKPKAGTVNIPREPGLVTFPSFGILMRNTHCQSVILSR